MELPAKGEGIDLLSELAQVFALPGTWSTLDVASIDFDAQTGELTLPLLPLALPLRRSRDYVQRWVRDNP